MIFTRPYIVTLYDQSELDNHLNKTKFDLIISDYQLDDITKDKVIMCQPKVIMCQPKDEFKDLYSILFITAQLK